jgi:copper transport protein
LPWRRICLTGHASAAPPQWLTRPAASCTPSAWRCDRRAGAARFLLLSAPRAVLALRRFSRLIPFVVWPLVASGLVLAVVQLGAPGALVTTGYGVVLLAKGALLVVDFALAAVNRMWLTQPALAGNAAATRRLAASVVAEVVILPRSSPSPRCGAHPPPRSFAAVPVATAATTHLQCRKGSAMVSIERRRRRRRDRGSCRPRRHRLRRGVFYPVDA